MDKSGPTIDNETKIRVSGESYQQSGPSTGGASLESCGDFDMRIARDGTWYYRGTPIGRKPLVKLFSNVLRRDEEGVFWLVTPVEKGRIIVDDAPFTAVELDVRGEGEEQILSFRNNVDDCSTPAPIIRFGSQRPRRAVNPAPTYWCAPASRP